MKWPKKYKDYYEYYADRIPYPTLLGVVFIAICLAAYVVYRWIH